MSGWIWVLIVIAVIVVILLIVFAALRRRRSSTLQERFGPEYQRTVTESDSRRDAEKELLERQKRRESLQLRELEPAARERYREAWQGTQARFVDAPSDAIRQADSLVTQVMSERGYPMEDFEQRAADISVDHPDVVQDYRAAHGISLANDQGQASTEDLRQAMVHYRSLYETMLGEGRGVLQESPQTGPGPTPTTPSTGSGATSATTDGSSSPS